MPTHAETMPGPAAQQPAAVVEERLFCALTGRPISHAEAYWAPPLVTARQLVSTVLRTLVTAPANLGPLLFDEQPNVPYAADVRERLAARRSAEQLKLLLGLLTLVALVALPLIWLSMR
jgi:hypothetical protein